MEAGNSGDGSLPMLSVRNAYKSYVPGRFILRGLNLTVPRGAIYAFLGPSGCGKTTLLSCLVGRNQLDSGQISLGITHKHQLGYMPQETALLEDITIKEILNFFGRLFGITSFELMERKQELYDFLDLPHESRFIGSLSGGQQRRVSLCIALLHDPQLLILDEPTVGLDPVLSHSIWEYLKDLTLKKGKTIIVTTHYIEEARNSDLVGMMRDGVLLVEKSPNALMKDYGTDQLEEIFLNLSLQQEHQHQRESTAAPSPGTSQKAHTLKGKQLSANRVLAHIMKNALWLIGNKVTLVFLITVPIVTSIAFCLAIGGDPRLLNFGIVNDELSEGWPGACSSRQNLSCSAPSLASCMFLRHLEERDLNLINFLDKESAEEATRRGEVWGYLHINRSYTESFFTRAEQNMVSSDDVLEGSQITVFIDTFHQYIRHFIKRDIYFSYKDYTEELYAHCDWPVKAAGVPIGYMPPVYGSLFPKFTEFALPTILLLLMFYLPIVYICGSVLKEKREGLMERTIVSGMSMLEYLVGSGFMCVIILVPQTLSILFILFGLFERILKGSFFLIFLVSMYTGVCGTFLGLLIAVCCELDTAAAGVGLGTFFFLTFSSGMLWPVEGAHYLLRTAGQFLPLAATTEAIRSIASRGLGLPHPTVYPAFIALSAWIAIFSTATYIALKTKNFTGRLFS